MPDKHQLAANAPVPFDFDHLPSLPADSVAIYNEINAIGQEWSFSLRGMQAHLKLIYDVSPPKKGTTVSCRVGSTNLQITMGVALTEVLPKLLNCSQQIDTVEEVGLGMLFEHAISAELDRLENLTGETIRIQEATTAVSTPKGPVLQAALTIADLDLRNIPVLFAAGHASRELLPAFFAISANTNAQPVPDIERLPIPLSRMSPAFALRVGSLKAARCGQVIALDDHWSGPKTSFLKIGHRTAATLSAGNGTIKIDSFMNDHDKGPEPMTMLDDQPRQLDDLDVTLTLELDRTEIRLADLSQLKEGAVLPFETTQPETVRLFANGQFFATAELLFIDNRIGVRLTQLA